METFIKTRTALFYTYWRDSKLAFIKHQAGLWMVLFISLWVVAAIVLSLNYQTTSAQLETSSPSSLPPQLTRQEFADQYRDLSLTPFLGN